MGLQFAKNNMPKFLADIISFFQNFTPNRIDQTTKEYLDAHFTDPKIKALLASQWGDYGLLPSESSFGISYQMPELSPLI